MRHGQSEGNLNELNYLQKGDSNVGLTDLGWEQTIRAGEFASLYYAKTGTDEWPEFFISPYQRTRESTSGFLHGLDGTFSGEPKFHEDPRLIEIFFGAMGRKRNPQGIVDPNLADELKNLAHHTYAVDRYATRTLYGESRMDVQTRLRSFYDGTLTKKIAAGQDDFFSAVHGVVIQENIRIWKGLHINDKIPNPHNGDIFEFEGEPGACTITKIYDGEKMTPVHEPYVDNLKKHEFSDLPAVPQHIIDGMTP